MSTKPRSDLLTTTELYNLDAACRLIRRAFVTDAADCGLYLVGSAGMGGAERYRDVDVRLMLGVGQFAAVCPTRDRWEALCVTIGTYLSASTGLPVDFQIQRTDIANEKFSGGFRNPLGMGRIFAGGGDGTPEWGGAA